MLIFFFALALSALHLYNEPKFMVIGNPVILEQYHAHNAPDLWDRGSMYVFFFYPTSYRRRNWGRVGQDRERSVVRTLQKRK